MSRNFKPQMNGEPGIFRAHTDALSRHLATVTLQHCGKRHNIRAQPAVEARRRSLRGASGEPRGSLRGASGEPPGGYRLATSKPRGGLRVASGSLRVAREGVPVPAFCSLPSLANGWEAETLFRARLGGAISGNRSRERSRRGRIRPIMAWGSGRAERASCTRRSSRSSTALPGESPGSSPDTR